jgi:DNA-binding IclR family transcriptional regulator
MDRPSKRGATKQQLLINMLERDGGTSIAEIVAATGWQSNTVHSTLTTLRKQGARISTDRTAQGNRYQIIESSSDEKDPQPN